MGDNTPVQRPSAAGRWLDSNAKWFVPLVVVAVIGLGFVGTLSFLNWFDEYMRALPPFRMAMQELRSHREANDLLGPPIEAEGRVLGNFTRQRASSQANLSIPVQGTRAKGRLFVFSTAVGDDWTLLTVTLRADSPPRNVVIVKHDGGR